MQSTEPSAEQEVAVPQVDSTPRPEEQEISARVLEVQRTGGRASRVILNVGGNQGMKKGFQGSLIDPKGLPVAGIIIRQVDPDLSLAEIISLGSDIEGDVTAIIQKPPGK